MQSYGEKTLGVKLGIRAVIAYGILMLPLSLGWGMLVAHIPTFYGATVGIGLGLAGIIIAFGRAFDIGTDFLIGWGSDRTRGKLFGRKTWVLFGTPLFCGFFTLLLLPPESAGPVYLAFVMVGYFLCYTLVEIPHSAIGLELANDAQTKTRLAASKSVFLVGGGMGGAALPALWDGDATLAYPNIVIIAWCFAAIALPIFMMFVPRTVPSVTSRTPTFKNTLNFLRRHAALQRLLLIFVLVQVSSSFLGILSLQYAAHVLGVPEKVGLFWLASGIGFLCGVPVWIYATRQWSRLQVWSVALVGLVPVFACFFLLGKDDVYPMFAVSALVGFFGACDAVVFLSMLASIVKEEETESGFGFGGGVSALRYFISKAMIAVPLVVALPFLTLIGLDEPSTLTPPQALLLTGLYAGVPMLARTCAFLLLVRAKPLLASYK